MLLKNGIVHDAVRPEPYQADILVENGKIKSIGQNLPEEGEIIDLAVFEGDPMVSDSVCRLVFIDGVQVC